MPYQTINPYTDKLIKEYPQHDDNYVESALATAHQLYKSDWAQGDISQRLAVLTQLAELFTQHEEELAKPSAKRWAN